MAATVMIAAAEWAVVVAKLQKKETALMSRLNG